MAKKARRYFVRLFRKNVVLNMRYFAVNFQMREDRDPDKNLKQKTKKWIQCLRDFLYPRPY